MTLGRIRQICDPLTLNIPNVGLVRLLTPHPHLHPSEHALQPECVLGDGREI